MPIKAPMEACRRSARFSVTEASPATGSGEKKPGMAKTGSCRNTSLRTGFGHDPDGSCTLTLLQLLPGPGGTGTTLGDFKGRASHNTHLWGVSCFFPKTMLCRVICGSAGWAWIKVGRGNCCFRAAVATEWPEGQIFAPELAIEVGFMPFNLRETWASPVMGDI